MEPEITGFQIATMVVAAVGAGLALGTFIWQLVSWRLSGGRPELDLRLGGVSVQGGLIAAAPISIMGESSLHDFSANGMGVILRVRNKGRMPFSVSDLRVCFSATGEISHHVDFTVGPLLPWRIEAGAIEQWGMPVEDLLSMGEELSRWRESHAQAVRAFAEKHGQPLPKDESDGAVWMEVTTGGRKVLKTQRIPL